ncbi:MAG: hypothetical protein K2N41_09500, partial [Lachnospiraceae bacterium]|nr:hypothetical protein [Lachnospiraceae bacterium]
YKIKAVKQEIRGGKVQGRSWINGAVSNGAPKVKKEEENGAGKIERIDFPNDVGGEGRHVFGQ